MLFSDTLSLSASSGWYVLTFGLTVAAITYMVLAVLTAQHNHGPVVTKYDVAWPGPSTDFAAPLPLPSSHIMHLPPVERSGSSGTFEHLETQRSSLSGSYQFLNTKRASTSSMELVTNTPTHVLLFDLIHETKPFPAWMTEASPKCVRIVTGNHKVVGTYLSVRQADAAENAPWVKLVVHNQHNGVRGWEIECRFLKTPGPRTMEFILEAV